MKVSTEAASDYRHLTVRLSMWDRLRALLTGRLKSTLPAHSPADRLMLALSSHMGAHWEFIRPGTVWQAEEVDRYWFDYYKENPWHAIGAFLRECKVQGPNAKGGYYLLGVSLHKTEVHLRLGFFKRG